jgi:hypothetical protein
MLASPKALAISADVFTAAFVGRHSEIGQRITIIIKRMLSLLNIPGLRGGLYATERFPPAARIKAVLGKENQCITFVGVLRAEMIASRSG